MPRLHYISCFRVAVGRCGIGVLADGRAPEAYLVELPAMIENVQKKQGAYLPHWTANGASYFVTFRLAGSLPSSLLKEIQWEQQDIEKTVAYVKRGFAEHEQDRLEDLHFKELDFFLRGGPDHRWLAEERIARLVADALMCFEGKRYTLFAWSIMPNHVHIVFQPRTPQWPLAGILHSWKSFTAHEANALLDRKGSFWQRESFDHLIRDENDLHRCIDYTWMNPEYAGLTNWKWRWKKAAVIA